MTDPTIDLHAHSTWSDGTSGVADLFGQARRARVDVLALTDHDTVAGWGELPAAAVASGVAAVPGIEVSTEQGDRSIHVLALLVDPSERTPLAQELAAARISRARRARRMVDLVARDYPITWTDVQAQVAGRDTVIGRPHIADALVAAGSVPDRSAAFDRILGVAGGYYVPYYAPSPVDAVRAIDAAGGVAIAAHPGSLTRGTELPLSLLEEMVEAGLAGLEVAHREHGAAERARLTDFARAHDLLVTGGSDFHGTGKPNRLGENLTAPGVLAQIQERASSGTTVIRP